MLKVAAAMLLLVAAPAAAQVRSTDAEVVTNFVNSKNEVPEQDRAGAVGGPVLPVKAYTEIDWEKKAADVDRQRARVVVVAECAKRLITDVPVRVPIENAAQQNQWLPDWGHSLSLEEMDSPSSRSGPVVVRMLEKRRSVARCL